jgi:hypothetical protein
MHVNNLVLQGKPKPEGYISLNERSALQSMEAFWDFTLFVAVFALFSYVAIIFIMVTTFVKQKTSLVETMKEEKNALKGKKAGYIAL